MADGWTKKEIKSEFKRRLAECTTNEQRNLMKEIFAHAQANGYSWPLQPKFVAPPPLHLNELLQ